MKKIPIIFCCLILVGLQQVTAQDPQFSQFYAAPLYLNPAFTGSSEGARIGMNYRNQWPSIDANFNTINAWGDYYIESKNSGVGVLLNRDTQGTLGLHSTSIGLLYAYHLQLSKTVGFSAGTQVAMYNRSINFDQLIFGDQFDPATGNLRQGYQSVDANQGQSKFFGDFSLGGLFYSPRAWIGLSAFHINRPNQSLMGATDKLPIKINVHAGYKFFLTPGTMGHGYYTKESERSIAPAIQYRRMGYFEQLDLGSYITLEPIVLGLWYRGLPIKKYANIANNESLVFSFGITRRTTASALNIGYSYDFTISKLGFASGGAHEVSIVYSWSTRDPRKPAKDKLSIPCPRF